MSAAQGKQGLVWCRIAPPIHNAQLFSVGRFCLWNPHATWGCGPLCVCQPLQARVAKPTQFAPVLLSLLSNPAPTSSHWHTQNALCDNGLRPCHCHWLSGVFGAAIHHAQTSPAQGSQLSHACCRVFVGVNAASNAVLAVVGRATGDQLSTWF